MHVSFRIKNGAYWLQGENAWTSQRAVAREFKTKRERDRVLATLKGTKQPAPCAGALAFFDGPYPNAYADGSGDAASRFKEALSESADE